MTKSQWWQIQQIDRQAPAWLAEKGVSVEPVHIAFGRVARWELVFWFSGSQENARYQVNRFLKDIALASCIEFWMERDAPGRAVAVFKLEG